MSVQLSADPADHAEDHVFGGGGSENLITKIIGILKVV